jgi:hypothetical protein
MKRSAESPPPSQEDGQGDAKRPAPAALDPIFTEVKLNDKTKMADAIVATGWSAVSGTTCEVYRRYWILDVSRAEPKDFEKINKDLGDPTIPVHVDGLEFDGTHVCWSTSYDDTEDLATLHGSGFKIGIKSNGTVGYLHKTWHVEKADRPKIMRAAEQWVKDNKVYIQNQQNWFKLRPWKQLPEDCTPQQAIDVLTRHGWGPTKPAAVGATE